MCEQLHVYFARKASSLKISGGGGKEGGEGGERGRGEEGRGEEEFPRFIDASNRFPLLIFLEGAVYLLLVAALEVRPVENIKSCRSVLLCIV